MGNSRIQFKRGKSAFWASENPVLFSGEPGYETNTKKFKIGDGETPWNELPYSGYVDDSGPVVIPVPGAQGPPGPPGPPDTTTANALQAHVVEETTPHPFYDDGRSLFLLYQNAKV